MFTEAEFKEAFQKMDKDGNGFITPDEVEDLLFETYGFPPLEEEIESKNLNRLTLIVFMQEFDLNHDGKVTWDEFTKAMGRMKEKLDKKASGASEYKSFSKLKDDRVKHRRMGGELQEKYKNPMTFNQKTGFYHKDPNHKKIMEM